MQVATGALTGGDQPASDAAAAAGGGAGGQAAGAALVWNYAEFRVTFPSLAKHTCIGGVYVRLLLDGADSGRWVGGWFWSM
jgi:hypothetical protein